MKAPLSAVLLTLFLATATLADSPSAIEFLDARQSTDGDVHPPDTWSATDNVAWKLDIPGLGWSSPIVWEDKIFLTTCINTGKGREPKMGLYIEEVNANLYPKETNDHLYQVICVSLSTGDVLWNKTAHTGIPPKPHHIKNTLASETATTDGERVYAMFGNVGIYCYDMDGNLIWERPIKPREMQLGWGTSISPILHGDRLYIVNDNEEDSYIAALDKKTGKEIWRTERDAPSNFSTPFVWENEVRTEIVTSGRLFARSYDLDGQELWRVEAKTPVAVPRPFEKHGLVYLCTGHVAWGENRTYAILPGASGDITPYDDNNVSQYIKWWNEQGSYHPTPLVIDDRFYMLLDRGFMLCYNAKTGEEVFKKRRISGGKGFTSSPWSYDDKIFAINEEGITFVWTGDDQFELLHKNTLADDDKGMATPVVIGDKLLIRTSARLYCIDDDA